MWALVKKTPKNKDSHLGSNGLCFHRSCLENNETYFCLEWILHTSMLSVNTNENNFDNVLNELKILG